LHWHLLYLRIRSNITNNSTTPHMLQDKSGKLKHDPDLIKGDVNSKSKRIIFIRHGESDWNLIFNKGKLKMPFRLLRALFREVFMLGKNDSVFYDSPLNEEGQEQALNLMRFLDNPSNSEVGNNNNNSANAEAIGILSGFDQKSQSSVIVTSNLRRAIATSCIGLWVRTCVCVRACVCACVCVCVCVREGWW
jgi:hypothetical protein